MSDIPETMQYIDHGAGGGAEVLTPAIGPVPSARASVGHTDQHFAGARPHTSFISHLAPLPGRNINAGVRLFF